MLLPRFTLPLAIIQIISWHTATSPIVICFRDDCSTHSIRVMMHVVLVFKDLCGIIRSIIVTLQKWFMIFNLLIHGHSVTFSCKIVVGGLCIIANMISSFSDQTSVTHPLYYIYYYYDILMTPRIK